MANIKRCDLTNEMILKSIRSMPNDELKVHYWMEVYGRNRSKVAKRLGLTTYKVNKLIGNIIDYILNDDVLKKTTFLQLEAITLLNLGILSSLVEDEIMRANNRYCKNCDAILDCSNCDEPASSMDMCNYCYKEFC